MSATALRRTRERDALRAGGRHGPQQQKLTAPTYLSFFPGPPRLGVHLGSGVVRGVHADGALGVAMPHDEIKPACMFFPDKTSIVPPLRL